MSAFSKIAKHTSTISAIATVMTFGSVAQALNGMSLNLTKSAPATTIQLANMICQGNWVGAGCTDGSAGSSGGQGSANPATEKAKVPDCSYFRKQSLILIAGCGTGPGPAPALHSK